MRFAARPEEAAERVVPWAESATSAAKAVIKTMQLPQRFKRCATQNQVEHTVFPQPLNSCHSRNLLGARGGGSHPCDGAARSGLPAVRIHWSDRPRWLHLLEA